MLRATVIALLAAPLAALTAARSADGVASVRVVDGARDKEQVDSKRAAPRRPAPFAFGYRYTHFFYAISADPPHQLLATSAEFCIGSLQDQTDCESVQVRACEV